MGGDETFDWGGAMRSFQVSLKALQKAGYTLSSYQRSVRANIRAKGDPFSQHLVGTAADFAVAPERVPAFVELARREGLRVVNEMNRPGHGPHLHVQLYRAGGVPKSLVYGVYSGTKQPPGVQIQETP